MTDTIPAELGGCHVCGGKPDLVFVSRSGFPRVMDIKHAEQYEAALKHAGYFYVEFSDDIKEETNAL